MPTFLLSKELTAYMVAQMQQVSRSFAVVAPHLEAPLENIVQVFGEEKILPAGDRVLASLRSVYDHTEAWLAETAAPDPDPVDTD